MLNEELKEQLKKYFELLQDELIFEVSLDDSSESEKMIDFLSEITKLTPKIKLNYKTDEYTPSFKIKNINEKEARIKFACIPLAHEFNTFVLAVVQLSTKKIKINEEVKEKITNLKTYHNFKSYISLNCPNCPDVVQAINSMAILNNQIMHTIVDGNLFRSEVEEKNILAVPTVYQNEEKLFSGRHKLEQILGLITDFDADFSKYVDKVYDVLVVGGGPAGVTSAIYAARKGIKTALLTDNTGGQVLDTVGIDNITGINHIEGQQLANKLYNHMEEYDVDLISSVQVKEIKKDGNLFKIKIDEQTAITSKTVIIATGAKWIDTNVPGEKEFKNKGVTHCPHCDGPLFQDKDVIVIGGGNSGVEAGIDLANIAKSVKILEFMPEVKADQVLQNKVNSLKNIEIITNAQTTKIEGQKTVNSLTYVDRVTQKETKLDAEGVFVLIGLKPNTEWLGDYVEKTARGEIVVNEKNETSIEGIFAAGDCTNSPYKQIVISMGSGATAALSAFDYIIRN